MLGLAEGPIYDLWLDLTEKGSGEHSPWGWDRRTNAAIYRENNFEEVHGFVHLRIQKHYDPKVFTV